MLGIHKGFYHNNEIIRRIEWCTCHYLVYDRCSLMSSVFQLRYEKIFDNWNRYQLTHVPVHVLLLHVR